MAHPYTLIGLGYRGAKLQRLRKAGRRNKRLIRKLKRKAKT